MSTNGQRYSGSFILERTEQALPWQQGKPSMSPQTSHYTTNKSSPSHFKGVIPSATYAYFDKIAFWIENVFTEEEKAFIRSQCGPGGTDIDRNFPGHRARFDPRLIQRIETRQPTPALRKFLSTVPGIHLNMAEFTLDLIFNTEEERDEMWKYLDQHLVKRKHKGTVRYFKGTRYTDRRWASLNHVAYRPLFAKLTGEVYCIHLEIRVCGAAALRRLKIGGIADLVEFDHHAFWETRLLLKKVRDFGQLGRSYFNSLRPNRKDTPRKPRVFSTRAGFVYYTDRRLGQTILRASRTVQNMIDAASRSEFPVNRTLVRIDNTPLLPANSNF
ncbi:hypothetical protein [Bradyrhizobium sp. WU425]|uniref:hypothetical protein n=1 Tax=Bradyrhizobium sp. WU425 TaxID=187029 RepID=UPI001E62118B|nr:hypothetical protein [Bradyrhizobium canariense]UFW69204.1 hypothetical protein BcanWU425_20780 [Bradyrhizobium canariense]